MTKKINIWSPEGHTRAEQFQKQIEPTLIQFASDHGLGHILWQQAVPIFLMWWKYGSDRTQKEIHGFIDVRVDFTDTGCPLVCVNAMAYKIEHQGSDASQEWINKHSPFFQQEPLPIVDMTALYRILICARDSILVLRDEDFRKAGDW